MKCYYTARLFKLLQKTFFLEFAFVFTFAIVGGDPIQNNSRGVLQLDVLLNVVTGVVTPQINNSIINDPNDLNRIICAPSCPMTWINDGWCDSACLNEQCQNDGSDCEGWCSGDCKSSWIGDGFCDIDCYNAECKFDESDCQNVFFKNYSFPFLPHESFDYSQCQKACNQSLLHNLLCDDSCNTFECNLDGGDCKHMCNSMCPTSWLGDGECDYSCNNEKCYYDKGDCVTCKEGCEQGMVGNGICDMQCNNEECSYDMGDCYGVCWVASAVDYTSEPFFYPHCRDEWKGDGFCDCFCVLPDCQFDFNDCIEMNCNETYKTLENAYRKLGILEQFPKAFSTLS